MVKIDLFSQFFTPVASFFQNKCFMCCVFYAGHRLSDFYIRVGKTFNETTFDPTTYSECWYQSTALGEGEKRQFICIEAIVGSYVTVHFPMSKTGILQLCEVEVYAEGSLHRFR